MKFFRSLIGLTIIIAMCFSTGFPKASTQQFTSFPHVEYGQSDNFGEVADVPYVWQEMNGFCYWATLSMALQSIDIQLDLAEVLTASGVGFSAGYVRYEDTWTFISGSSYRQQNALSVFAELYGFDVDFYMDSSSTSFGSAFSQLLDFYNITWIEVDGWDDAFQNLKTGIDSGFPVEIYVNLQNLPASDYDIIRNLGITDSTPTHSILVTGYNETSGNAQIMDPGIGVLNEPTAIPNDGSWSYEISLSSLNQAWLGCYGTTIVKPGTGIDEEFTHALASYILDRLRGDRNSYAPESEEVFFWNYGSNAFRALAADLTATGLSSFMNELEEYDLRTKSIILQNLGMVIEGALTQQYVSYRAAIEVLPGLLSDLDLQNFVSKAEVALEHFEIFSDNSTVNTPFYTGGEKLVTKTIENIAYQYEHVFDGDMSTAASVYEEDLAAIQTHLNAIATAWDAAADALDMALNGAGKSPIVLFSASVAGVVVLAIVFVRRRSSM